MKIAILGSGGREHALTFSVSKSNKVEKIYCIPGNAGTSELAENISIDINDFKKVYEFLKKNNIDFVVVGPEDPLVNGIVDYLEKLGIKVFGPNKIVSQLEGSKIFTKKLCKKYNIPTAKFGIFTSIEQSINFFKDCNYPVVIKALIEKGMNYYRDFVLPNKQYRIPGANEVDLLRQLLLKLEDADLLEEAELQAIPFELARKTNTDPKSFFQMFYEIVLGQERGPRFGSFAKMVGLEQVRKMIHDRIV